MTMVRGWHPSRQDLRYQLGDLILFRWRIPVLACEFGPDMKAEEVVLPPVERLEVGMIGFVMRGVPSDTQRPLFEQLDNYVLYTPHQYQRYYLDLSNSFDEYQKKFRSKSRSTIRRKVKKFSQLSGGTIDFRVYRSAESMDEFHDAARSISAHTYQERLLDAGLPTGVEYKDQLRAAATNDGVRGYILFHEGTPVSYLLLTAADDILIYRYLGFDPNFGKLSIGTVLHWLALENLFQERRFRLLDFTEGEGEQKRQFATDSIRCANIYCLRRSLATRLRLRLHATMDKVSGLIGTALATLGLRRTIRKLLRR